MRTGACARMPVASLTTSSGARAARGAALRHFRCQLAFASRQRRRPMLCLQPLKHRADGSAEAGQDVEPFEDSIRFERHGAAVCAVNLDYALVGIDDPNGFAPVLEIQPDLHVQAVGLLGGHHLDSEVGRALRQIFSDWRKALVAQHAQVRRQSLFAIEAVCGFDKYPSNPVLTEPKHQYFVQGGFDARMHESGVLDRKYLPVDHLQLAALDLG